MENGVKEVIQRPSEDDAKRLEYDLKVVFGNQISWMGVRKKSVVKKEDEYNDQTL